MGLHQTKGETNLCRAVRQQDMEHFLPPCRHTLETLPTTLLTLPVSLGTLSTNQSPRKHFLPLLNYFIQPWDNFLPHNKYFLPPKISSYHISKRHTLPVTLGHGTLRTTLEILSTTLGVIPMAIGILSTNLGTLPPTLVPLPATQETQFLPP